MTAAGGTGSEEAAGPQAGRPPVSFPPAELAGRWQSALVLKRDVFSTVERGVLSTPDGEREGVLRRLDQVPWWSRPLARLLFRNEVRALSAAAGLGIAPPLLFAGRQCLVRGWVAGLPLHLARPHGDGEFLGSARAALRALRRRGIAHNDLAKEQNWLVGGDGRAMLIDFQLALVSRRRGRLFRLAAYEDLRHYLKHRRTYAPTTLTPSQRRILARKSLPTRIWMATGKRLYRLVTRGVLGYADREGGGPRLAMLAPRIETMVTAMAGVTGAKVVAFPRPAGGTALYAFVETRLPEGAIAAALSEGGVERPDHIQTAERLPRDADGRIRQEALLLIAGNQIELLDRLRLAPEERALCDDIARARRNLSDRRPR